MSEKELRQTPSLYNAAKVKHVHIEFTCIHCQMKTNLEFESELLAHFSCIYCKIEYEMKFLLMSVMLKMRDNDKGSTEIVETV